MWDESLQTQPKRGKKENNAKENSRLWLFSFFACRKIMLANRAQVWYITCVTNA